MPRAAWASTRPISQSPTAADLERRKDLALSVANRTIYQHFGGKAAMFGKVIFTRDSEAALDPPRLEPSDTLLSALNRMANYIYAVTFRERSIGQDAADDRQEQSLSRIRALGSAPIMTCRKSPPESRTSMRELPSSS